MEGYFECCCSAVVYCSISLGSSILYHIDVYFECCIITNSFYIVQRSEQVE